MLTTIFIDTGAFFARYVEKDQYHSLSIKLWSKIQKEKLSCMKTNAVIIELINLLLRRTDRQTVLQIAQEIYQSQILDIQSITPRLELQALHWLEKFADQDFSLTDTLSFSFMTEHKIIQAFSFMTEHKIIQAFTFDHHFEVAGFQKFGGDYSKK